MLRPSVQIVRSVTKCVCPAEEHSSGGVFHHRVPSSWRRTLPPSPPPQSRTLALRYMHAGAGDDRVVPGAAFPSGAGATLHGRRVAQFVRADLGSLWG